MIHGASPAATAPGAGRYPSMRLCVGYGMGSAGVAIMLNTVSVYFPALMSTVLGVSPVVAGTLLMLSKLYDAFADVVIGTSSDRTQSRWGRRRPYLLAGAIGSFLSLCMIFLAPPLGSTALIVYMGLALVVYSTGYSLFNVPYLALPADITRSNGERLRLISFRTAAIGIGQLTALALSAWLIQRGGGGASGYRMMGIVMAVLALSFMLISFLGTARARLNEVGTTTHKPSLRDLGDAMGNRPLMLLLGAKLCQYVAFGVMQPINLLFLLNITSLGMTGMIHLAIVQNLMIFVSMPVWTRLGVRLGKRNAYLLAQAIMIPSVLSWWWADADLGLPGLWARGMSFGFASAGALLMSTSIL
ncbi:MAG: MFS transporter, partial [Sphingobium sp.]